MIMPKSRKKLNDVSVIVEGLQPKPRPVSVGTRLLQAIQAGNAEGLEEALHELFKQYEAEDDAQEDAEE